MSQETSPDAVEVTIITGMDEISPEDWDACAKGDKKGKRPADPFTTHRFLKALEDSGSVGAGTGWVPRHLVVRQQGCVIAVMPSYAKGHSQGEYIFDHNWAHAYEQAGGQYYPKLQAAVPFTPVTGRRFLTRAEYDGIGASALLQGAVQMAANNNLSSVHVTFCTKSEYEAGGHLGFMQRIGQQFHWFNKGYDSFDDFLAHLSSRKRKNIRKERATANGFGGEIYTFTGDEIKAEHWDAFWVFYQDTGARKWGQPYLTRAFFDYAQKTLRDDIVLMMCKHNGRWVAGALNFIGNKTLYGRYWGCVEDHSCLHFELCYYRAIDFAIAHGLKRVEAGAQGEHKLARGYMPRPVYSLHWFKDKHFSDAVARYLDAERNAVNDEIEILTDYGPFKSQAGGGDDSDFNR